MLVHGINASGKTRFIGDFLATEAKNGKVKYINVRGEDGALTLKGMGLGNVGENVESYDDYDQVLDECIKANDVVGLGVDSLEPLNRWVRAKLFKSDRMPSSPDEWQVLHRTMANLMTKQRRAAKYVVCACVSDKSTDQVTGSITITPDLPGREARGSAGWFDFVAYIQASVKGPGVVERILVLTPNNTITVRQRLPKQIAKDLVLPDGAGGWGVFKNAIIAASTVGPK
jgi:hypothetical protein